MKVPVEPGESAADERSIDEGLADADAGNLHDAADVFAQLRLKLEALRLPHDQGTSQPACETVTPSLSMIEVTLPTAAVEKVAALAKTPAKAGARLRAAAKRR
jgi:hypothetical protein